MMSTFSEGFAAAFQDAAEDAGFLLVATVRPKICGRAFELLDA